MTLQEYCKINNFDEVKTFILNGLDEFLKTKTLSQNFFNYLLKIYNETDDKKATSLEEVSPKHYSSLKIEPIKFITENNLNFCAGNIVKYVSRLGNKDSKKDEIKKIFFYFDYLVNNSYDLTIKTFKK